MEHDAATIARYAFGLAQSYGDSEKEKALEYYLRVVDLG